MSEDLPGPNSVDLSKGYFLFKAAKPTKTSLFNRIINRLAAALVRRGSEVIAQQRKIERRLRLRQEYDEAAKAPPQPYSEELLRDLRLGLGLAERSRLLRQELTSPELPEDGLPKGWTEEEVAALEAYSLKTGMPIVWGSGVRRKVAAS